MSDSAAFASCYFWYCVIASTFHIIWQVFNYISSSKWDEYEEQIAYPAIQVKRSKENKDDGAFKWNGNVLRMNPLVCDGVFFGADLNKLFLFRIRPKKKHTLEPREKRWFGLINTSIQYAFIVSKCRANKTSRTILFSANIVNPTCILL